METGHGSPSRNTGPLHWAEGQQTWAWPPQAECHSLLTCPVTLNDSHSNNIGQELGVKKSTSCTLFHSSMFGRTHLILWTRKPRSKELKGLAWDRSQVEPLSPSPGQSTRSLCYNHGAGAPAPTSVPDRGEEYLSHRPRRGWRLCKRQHRAEQSQHTGC